MKSQGRYTLYLEDKKIERYAEVKKEMNRNELTIELGKLLNLSPSFVRVILKRIKGFRIERLAPGEYDCFLDKETIVKTQKNTSSQDLNELRKIKDILNYDEKTGWFRYKISRQRVRKGEMAGCVNNAGYVQININGKIFLAHRLAVYFATGKLPSGQVKHKNKNKGDNRIKNLEF